MAEIAASSEGREFPSWIKIPATAIGILFAGIGMSSVFRGGGFKEVLVPTAVGAIMILVSGFKKKLSVDEGGVTRETSFWGAVSAARLSWDDLSDVRVILGKGTKIYVLPHSDKKTWPLTFKREQSGDVLAILKKHLPEEKIRIEN